MHRIIVFFSIVLVLFACQAPEKPDTSTTGSGAVLPFSPAPSASTAGESKEVAKGTLERTATAAFSASETFDVGVAMGSSVSLRYHKKATFRFTGKISRVKVDLL
jgi:hypothetical protein